MATVTAMDARLVADIGNLIPPHWLTKVRSDMPHHEYFREGKFTGPSGSRSMLIQNDDFKTAPGNTITVTVEGELFKDMIEDENTLSGNEDSPDSHQFTVPIKYYSAAEAISRQANEEAMVNEIIAAGGRLARRAGKQRDELVFEELLSPAGGVTPTTLYGGSATSDASLTNSCALSPDEIDKCKLAIELMARPLELHDSATGEILQKYLMIIDPFSADKLFSNTTWRNAIQSAMERGFQHPLFTGALGQWNDIILSKYTQINPGCHQGTPQRPECAAYGTNSAGATTLTVGDSTSGKNYTKYFPSSGTIEINIDGTIHETTYSGKTDYSFTGLGSALPAGGVNAGDRVTYLNHRSQLIVTGAEAAVRAFKIVDRVLTNSEDYGRRRGVGIEFGNGTRAVEDSEGNISGYLLLDVWAKTPNHNI